MQPMDTGIIKNVKHYYRKMLARRRLVAFEAHAKFNFDLLKCCELLRCAWDMVSRGTIINCFKKVGFASSTDDSSETTEIDSELDDIIHQLRNHISIPVEVDAELYTALDDGIEVASALSDNEIVEPLQDDVEDEASDDVSPVPSSDAIEAAYVLH